MGYPQVDYCRKIPVQAEIHSLPILYNPNTVSQSFINAVFQTVSAIPESLLNILANKGFVLILSGSMSEVHPDLQFKKPRGHSQHSKYDHINGLCCPDERHIHITEHTKRGRARDTAETLRHEFGHALDASAGAAIGFGNRDVSLTFDFNQVFLQDVSQIPLSKQEDLEYYIQKKSPAGRSEAFAEGVASLIGGGCRESQYFQRYFPETVSWIENHIFSQLGLPTHQKPISITTTTPALLATKWNSERILLIKRRKQLMDSIVKAQPL